MIKHSIFFLLTLFLFTGCVERGHNITPTTVQHTIVQTDISNKNEMKNITKATEKVICIEEEESTTDDSLQNTISGILILVIGIMVFI
jgi:hypothetical protein